VTALGHQHRSRCAGFGVETPGVVAADRAHRGARGDRHRGRSRGVHALVPGQRRALAAVDPARSLDRRTEGGRVGLEELRGVAQEQQEQVGRVGRARFRRLAWLPGSLVIVFIGSSPVLCGIGPRPRRGGEDARRGRCLTGVMRPGFRARSDGSQAERVLCMFRGTADFGQRLPTTANDKSPGQ
jgi:hypothetical protein